ncbi:MULTISPECIES: mechanosensitive ion channel domain-containing protein [unclassified Synechococcus]|uniref:mechanosensitive ion channel family protein n=1 Tax=unclassified Synechococcus TaxID=2626047 RepID=UPI001C211912|nr:MULTISPECIES: mechanosensitive ion channel domain-containing protein [unclassified Synechococcus]
MSPPGFALAMALARVLLGSAAVWLVVRLLRRRLLRLERPPEAAAGPGADGAITPLLLHSLASLGYLAMVVWGWRSLVRDWALLRFDPGPDRLVEGAALLVATVLVVRLLNRSLLLLLERSLQRLGREEQTSTLRALAPMIRALFWGLGTLVFLQQQGVPLGAVYASLAGAGIGVGLALRGPLSHFINYLTIVIDKPFQIGDLIGFGDVLGPVERVGIRSSSIRSLSGERIVIGNEELLQKTIRNFGDLPRRRVAQTLRLSDRMAAEKAASIAGLVEEVIRAHPPAAFDRCHFLRFADGALEFQYVFFVPDSSVVVYLDLQQAINLGILQAFQSQGIEFAAAAPEPATARISPAPG